jgi:hypothetical protein
MFNEGGEYSVPLEPEDSSDNDLCFDMEERVFLLSPFGLPAREEGLYLHSAPNARHREHIGRALLHLTLARKQVSQDALNFGLWGRFEEVLENISAEETRL